jgi:HD superfamily phosphohydrolase YqeK
MMTNFERYYSKITELVEDPILRAIAGTYLKDKVHPNFYTAPASSSQKHHPDISNGPGGLVRHSIVTAHFAKTFCQPFEITDSKNVDAVVVSALLHDTFKGGPSNDWTSTHPLHDKTAAKEFTDSFMSLQYDARPSVWNEYSLYVSKISAAISTHMWIWGSTPTALHKMTTEGQILAISDYVASRKLMNKDKIDTILEGLY